MKKIYTLYTLMLLTSIGFAQNVPVDFETGGNGAGWTWTTFENDDNPALTVVDNPSKTGMNTSDKVAKFTARSTGQPWAGCESLHGSDIGDYKIIATNSSISIMVWKTNISDIGIKLVTASGWSKGELKVANTKTNEWEKITFDFSTMNHEDMTYDQIVIFPDFGARTADNVVYFDNITFGEATPPPTPMTAAPTPTVPAANAISLFSDAYTNVTVNTWRTDWSNAAFSEIEIEGNKTIKYGALDFVGVETVGENLIDATDMLFVHFDMWSADATTFRMKIVDFGADGAYAGGDDTEHEYVITDPAKETWNSLVIPFSDFTNLTNRAHVAQIIFSALPTGKANVYLDNIFFSKGGSASVNTLSSVKVNVYPNPSNGVLNINLKANSPIEQVQLIDLQGKVVFTENTNGASYTNTISTADFGAGVYFLQVKSENEVVNHKVIVQ